MNCGWLSWDPTASASVPKASYRNNRFFRRYKANAPLVCVRMGYIYGTSRVEALSPRMINAVQADSCTLRLESNSRFSSPKSTGSKKRLRPSSFVSYWSANQLENRLTAQHEIDLTKGYKIYMSIREHGQCVCVYVPFGLPYKSVERVLIYANDD